MMKQILISEQLRINDLLTLSVRGDCMRPVFASGDRIRVIKKRFYLPGDILVFHGVTQSVVSHRFLGYVMTPRGVQLLTKADHADQPDSLVQIQNIIGKIIQIAPCPELLRISFRKRFKAVCDWIFFVMKISYYRLFSIRK